MKIFIAGASGVLGRRLVKQFVARGHSAIGLVRSAKAETAVREAGGDPRHADLFDADSLAAAAEGCDTVIHAATSIPVKQKTTLADWAMNDRIRRKGTRCLTEAAAKIGAKTYLQQSIAWVARPANDSPFDEDSPTVATPTIQSAIDAESIAREAESAEGFTVSILRGGFFYDSESAHTRMIADALRKRQMPIVGGGTAMWAMIHTDDAASAFVHAAEKPTSGVWHIVDNELVEVRSFLKRIRRAPGSARTAPRSRITREIAHRRPDHRILHAVHKNNERALPPRFRLETALPDVQGRPRSSRCRVEYESSPLTSPICTAH